MYDISTHYICRWLASLCALWIVSVVLVDAIMIPMYVYTLASCTCVV